MRMPAALTLILTVALSSCGGTSSTDSSGQGPEPNPESTSTSSQPTQTPKPQGLTGYGATVQAWEADHGESVEGFTEGSVYGPVVREDMHKYFAVMAGERVTFYSRGFPELTSLEAAKNLLLQDFPSDASITAEDADEPSCVIALIESKQVRKATGSNATAAFFSPQGPSEDPTTPMDQGDVSNATVLTHHGGKKDLGRC